MQILIVEDEERVARFIARGLEAEGHRCQVAPDGAQGLREARHGDYDLIVLDRMLPAIDGVALCRQLRADGLRTPVLMLTALDAVEDRVSGLRAGADDYLAKPFDFDELLARIEALSRRGGLDSSETLEVGPLCVDVPGRRVTLAGSEVELTALEFDLLRLLASSAGRYWSRERILNRVWGSAAAPETNVVDVYVSRLRRKLGEGAGLIQTRRGVGYCLQAPAD